jgi:nucleoside phosphorylase
MKTLLIHALNQEAKLIKEQFQRSRRSISVQGVNVQELNEHYDLLRTGIGLQRTEDSLNNLPHPKSYDQFFQFGVSGSLSDDLPVHSIISAHSFTALEKNPIHVNEGDYLESLNTRTISFFSSRDVIDDEKSRLLAKSHGAQAVDMESYAVAEFCSRNLVPFKTLRIISDRAGASTPDEFKRNFMTASGILQKFIIEHVLRK